MHHNVLAIALANKLARIAWSAARLNRLANTGSLVRRQVIDHPCA
jgi:hypothetical protein